MQMIVTIRVSCVACELPEVLTFTTFIVPFERITLLLLFAGDRILLLLILVGC